MADNFARSFAATVISGAVFFSTETPIIHWISMAAVFVCLGVQAFDFARMARGHD